MSKSLWGEEMWHLPGTGAWPTQPERKEQRGDWGWIGALEALVDHARDWSLF